MIIQSKNFSLKLEEFPQDEIHITHFNETEKSVVKLVNDWVNGKEYFNFTTSGSTGQPKKIQIDRKRIEYSTRATFDHIDPQQGIKSTLLCIDPRFIGGAMVVFRALIKNLNLYIIDPTSQVVESLPPNFTSDLVSLVPIQFNAIPSNDLDRFKNIIIGGAAVTTCSTNDANIYASFGMTETVSHVALRRINSELYTTTGDTIVDLNTEGCLQFKGKITHNKWLETNDLGEIVSPTSFLWKGRKDFVINSGGIKINPEAIENKLAHLISSPFLITSLPDDRLGEKVVLLIEGNEQEIDFSNLDKFERPKDVYFDHELVRTSSGKIDRKETRKSLTSQ